MSTDYFRIRIPECKNAASDMNRIAKDLEQQKASILLSMSILENTRSYDHVKRNLRKLAERTDQQKGDLLRMSVRMEDIISLYQKAELNILCSSYASFQEREGRYEIDSVVFDDDGGYGGDQAGPMSEWGFWSEKKELYEIVRKYYPNMTDKEIKNFLKKLNDEGCGYVAAINTMFAAYEGREEEFERTFGFPMYKDGDLNYNKLLVDFYSATDNHNLGKDGFSDVINYGEDTSNQVGKGTNQYDCKYRTEMYLKEKGVDVDVHMYVDVTPNNVEELSKDGYVMIDYFYGNLQKENGRTAQYIDGGHGMIITGVTEDGRYIVSSWGEKYYIDPNEIIENNGKETHMSYSYYQYK